MLSFVENRKNGNENTHILILFINRKKVAYAVIRKLFSPHTNSKFYNDIFIFPNFYYSLLRLYLYNLLFFSVLQRTYT